MKNIIKTNLKDSDFVKLKYNNKDVEMTVGEFKDTINPSPTSSSYVYTETSLSSTDINGLDSEFNLLPVLTGSSYYDISNVIIEYTHNSTAYTTTSAVIGVTGGGFDALIDSELITNANTKMVKLGSMTDDSFTDGRVYPMLNPTYASSWTKLIMWSWAGDSPAAGDGTMLVKIWYAVKEFGTEL